MKNQILLLCIFLFLFITLNAQHTVISGFVKDSLSKEPLISASVYIENSVIGTSTNSYGYFTLKIPKENQNGRLVVSVVGYAPKFGAIDSNKGTETYFLIPGVELSEVNVISRKKIEVQPTMSMMKLSIKDIQYMPQLFQEDLIKSIQYLPGIQGGTEGSAGMFVRGGGADQNLILLDDVPLYYVNHAGNMISIFDNNAIKDFQLYKGAFPARYGGRLSSVLDIRMKEGDKNNYHGEFGLGLLSGNLFIEGPIIRNKISFFVSYRKFWPEYMLNLMAKYSNSSSKFTYGFDDLSAKISADITEKDKLMLSFYRGSDMLKIKMIPSYDENSYGLTTTTWSNLVGGLKYTRAISNNIFSDLTLYYTKYNYLNGTEYFYRNPTDTLFNSFYIKYNSNVEDFSGKLEVDYSPSSNLKFKFGGQFVAHRYAPGTNEYNTMRNLTVIDSVDFTLIKANEPSLFIESVYTPNANLEMNLGLRNSYFMVEGKTYTYFEPRVMIRYDIENLFSLKASYAEMVQTIHLLNYSGGGMPSDLWLPPTANIEPGRSKQGALGIYKTLFDGAVEISLEGYYKYLENMIAYKDGASFFASATNWKSKLETNGTGTSKGIELFVQKPTGNLTGWVSYTLAKTDRHFENKNNKKPYPFNYDRRHSITVVANYKLSEKIVLSGTWIYGSGYPITLGVTQYPKLTSPMTYKENLDFYGNLEYAGYFGDLNSIRMKPTHHLDIALTYTKKKKKYERIWNFSIYNVYNRHNPYFYYYESNGKGGVRLMQQSYFPIMPSITYSVKF
jgi:hypothetical protein